MTTRSTINTNHYIGRFAPSPTGELHMGSLVAAVGSYLRAKNHQGQWLVRMEDLDPLREVKGAADSILRTLEAHGLHWDGEVVYQSQRESLYTHALQQLKNAGQVYVCTCTRKALMRSAKRGHYGIIYPATCRKAQHSFELPKAIRVRTDIHNETICFHDAYKGKQCQNLEKELGDFIIKRSDGYFAYQLAVVVDDEDQGITEVVRGEDLLDNTARQIYLQKLLGFKQPDYCHLPMVNNEQGQKLSKQTHAPALSNSQASANIIQALRFLGVYNQPIEEVAVENEAPEKILQWAVENNRL
ncbi:MAG TPA: tRNA glutamyl-Q(34) synthetase GluQRS [Thiothrix sp.]|nr:tRNA glutamyl-Q(34) synthetase GluQRS [Thiothrix sp.]